MSIKLLSLFHAFGESDSKILGSVEIINSQLIGTGACLPDFVLTNAMLEHMVDTNDEWIVQRTGVRERRIAKNMHTWELALGAAQDALADAKIDAGELDLILVSTCTPDTNTPNTAAILQDKLGAGAVGIFLLWPLAVTAGIGAYKQKKLPSEIFEVVYRCTMGEPTSFRTAGVPVNAAPTAPAGAVCPQCGAQIFANARFCSACGAKLQTVCPGCGAPVKPGSKFCSECGQALS